jgi:integrase
MRLTVKKIERLKEPGRYRDDAVRGLYLQLRQKKGTKRLTGSWLLRYERGGVEHMLGLGPLSEVNLNQARDAARERREDLRHGIDPVATKRAEKQKQKLETTFQEAALNHIQLHQAGWKNAKHGAQWRSTLQTWAFPVIGSLVVRDVDTPSLLKVFRQEPKDHPGKTFWEALPETASRVRMRIEKVLDGAKVDGFRDGDNPARWRGHLEHRLPKPKTLKKVRHHPALHYLDLPAFIAELAKSEGVAARALEFTILTAARSNEVTGAKRAEIEETIWTVPPERMKAKRPHRVPLPPRAVAITKAVPRFDGNPHLFVSPLDGGKGLSSGALSAALRAVGEYRDKNGDTITVHGFRSTFKDWARETTAFQNEIVEAALAHVIGDKTEAAYVRSDVLEKRAKLMEAWAKYCATPRVKSAKILNMRGAANG